MFFGWCFLDQELRSSLKDRPTHFVHQMPLGFEEECKPLTNYYREFLLLIKWLIPHFHQSNIKWLIPHFHQSNIKNCQNFSFSIFSNKIIKTYSYLNNLASLYHMTLIILYYDFLVKIKYKSSKNILFFRFLNNIIKL